MMLTPKSRRFIDEALRGQPGAADRDRFIAWNDRTATGEATAEILRISEAALTNLEAHMFSQLERVSDEDNRVDLMNDLAFVRAVLKGIREARVPVHA
jgi:hypothetical protein